MYEEHSLFYRFGFFPENSDKDWINYTDWEYIYTAVSGTGSTYCKNTRLDANAFDWEWLQDNVWQHGAQKAFIYTVLHQAFLQVPNPT